MGGGGRGIRKEASLLSSGGWEHQCRGMSVGVSVGGRRAGGCISVGEREDIGRGGGGTGTGGWKRGRGGEGKGTRGGHMVGDWGGVSGGFGQRVRAEKVADEQVWVRWRCNVGMMVGVGDRRGREMR
eukprot:GHVQ01021661.1.p1 GENE.GHVQ01021661.1~~GHVQ01021661.1.p1  ORF type:complete len:127 (+),score=30.66 GHVQ01021661.1:80-460(+)